MRPAGRRTWRAGTSTGSDDAHADREQLNLAGRLCVGSRGGDVMALPFDTTVSDYILELMQAADTLVSGATTYRGFLSY